ncbi:MAG: GIY-YIG nuclease family protein [Ignavibacterium sp.]|nr:GIY-YIG nuclease family protein [Ignavibacterium sp.]
MDKEKILDEIFADDPFGLLITKLKISNKKTADELLLSSFNEIINFVDKNGMEPLGYSDHPIERILFSRLNTLRNDLEKVNVLKQYDIYNLLPDTNAESVKEPKIKYEDAKEINSIEDIFEDVDFQELSDDTAGLFDFNHTPKHFDRAETDFVARRKPCKNFSDYVHLFKQVQKELKESQRHLIQFKQDDLNPGEFYVHKGVLLYLERVDFKEEVQSFGSGSRIRKDGRTRIIFENGTESQMLYRSLYKILLANGKAITNTSVAVNEQMQNNFKNITNEDEESGFIYILKSLSENDKISSIDNLYKIGFSNIPVEERIKNAEKDPTYLMAPVKIVSAYKCYNLNPQKFELLIHTFFGKSCLNFDIFDVKGMRHSPREWFIVPLDIIERAIELIISGVVINYKYDELNQKIIIKES